LAGRTKSVQIDIAILDLKFRKKFQKKSLTMIYERYMIFTNRKSYEEK